MDNCDHDVLHVLTSHHLFTHITLEELADLLWSALYAGDEGAVNILKQHPLFNSMSAKDITRLCEAAAYGGYDQLLTKVVLTHPRAGEITVNNIAFVLKVAAEYDHINMIHLFSNHQEFNKLSAQQLVTFFRKADVGVTGDSQTIRDLFATHPHFQEAMALYQGQPFIVR